MKPEYVMFFEEIGILDSKLVGGKNASLGEMFTQLKSKGIAVPDGFALTSDAYRCFLRSNNLGIPLFDLLDTLDKIEFSNLSEVGSQARAMIMNGKFSEEIQNCLFHAYRKLCQKTGVDNLDVAVRSSATAEDLPSASFAGRMDSFLNIRGEAQLLSAVHRCYASLFTDRAIKYRYEMGFESDDLAISVGVQQMVRSDKASSGVIFTIDPDSGFNNVAVITSSWGLGENVVQGKVTPDEWIIFKPTLFDEKLNPILKSTCGRKEMTLSYAQIIGSNDPEMSTVNIETPKQRQNTFTLNSNEVIQLARWSCLIERHYGMAMDIEWAKDGVSDQLYILQARPETVHKKKNNQVRITYKLKSKSKLITSGIALGEKIAAGKARIITDPKMGYLLKKGEILVTDITNPDWDPILKKAAAIITNKGGRTSHAAIVARELGTVAVVGCGNALESIRDGQDVTVSCSEGKKGKVYQGVLEWDISEEVIPHMNMPKTAVMLNLADPDRAFELSQYPNSGVGLMRLEFVISNSVQIHPLALLNYDKINDEDVRLKIKELTTNFTKREEYFIDKVAEAVSIVAAAFYPKDVIVRLSDFKSDEYVNLIGGDIFEPKEENPMLGLRGASRYYSDFYKDAFALECRAIKKVREEMGFYNVKLMIPFCRTLEEGKLVISELELNGLFQNEKGLEIYVMIEIPANVILADQFAGIFDGFSIGSNDLTQLTLGIDRNSESLNYLFNEENLAVKFLIKESIHSAKKSGIKIGLCGQAPSDNPAFTRFLVDEGIDSISFSPDALLKGIKSITEAERHIKTPKWML
ncbi:phosphoenolpyruvate synthase [Arthrospiribacter ruber]|uniref:Phosphoenolpyruvate synthase n=1 Tax=Arthrospiribacter ruber TaxID=2487934 RepID=A0A951J035_9BACT|nr:phosphoenolpyruvate synthase [Arthrospiribacter ruber]MBW3469544.1 phosphoenolpyruvate synthase [Arthrospiribacter ruber]